MITLSFTNASSLTLRTNSFRGIKALSYLRINGTKLSYVEPGAFVPLSSLLLSIDMNNVNNLTSQSFDNIARELQVLQKLNSLYLENNGIEEINAEWFSSKTGGLPELAHIRLTRNKLRTVRKSDFTNTILKDLILDDNFIDSIESGAFDALVNLKELSVANNYLSEIPVLNNPNLMSINFESQNGRLKRINDFNFWPLKYRYYLSLNLGGNDIESFGENSFCVMSKNNNESATLELRVLKISYSSMKVLSMCGLLKRLKPYVTHITGVDYQKRTQIDYTDVCNCDLEVVADLSGLIVWGCQEFTTKCASTENHLSLCSHVQNGSCSLPQPFTTTSKNFENTYSTTLSYANTTTLPITINSTFIASTNYSTSTAVYTETANTTLPTTTRLPRNQTRNNTENSGILVNNNILVNAIVSDNIVVIGNNNTIN